MPWALECWIVKPVVIFSCFNGLWPHHADKHQGKQIPNLKLVSPWTTSVGTDLVLWLCCCRDKKEQKIAHFGAFSEMWRTSDQSYHYSVWVEKTFSLTFCLQKLKATQQDKTFKLVSSGCHWTFVPWSMNFFLHSPSNKQNLPVWM